MVSTRRLFALLVHKAEKPTAHPHVNRSLRLDATSVKIFSPDKLFSPNKNNQRISTQHRAYRDKRHREQGRHHR
jgi:hypothetical protein